jgi:hypothetical protein
MPRGEPAESVQLYDIATDEAEQHDLAASHPEAVVDLCRSLDEFLNQWRPLVPAAEAELDSETLEALRRMGYVGER